MRGQFFVPFLWGYAHMITHFCGLVNIADPIFLRFVITHKNEVNKLFRYDRLDELVQETGKKKNFLSKKMGFSERYLNDAKKQKTNIKGEELKILADELDTTPEYLTGETDVKEKHPAENGRVLNEANYRVFLESLSFSELAALNAEVVQLMVKKASGEQ